MFIKLFLLFITQMGDPTYLRTSEDHQQMQFYAEHYEKFTPQGEIPQTLHFIWVGGSALPAESRKNIAKWVRLHPGWKVKLWSDRGVFASSALSPCTYCASHIRAQI